MITSFIFIILLNLISFLKAKNVTNNAFSKTFLAVENIKVYSKKLPNINSFCLSPTDEFLYVTQVTPIGSIFKLSIKTWSMLQIAQDHHWNGQIMNCLVNSKEEIYINDAVYINKIFPDKLNVVFPFVGGYGKFELISCSLIL